MGNKLSCSCAPILRKAYRYEDSPWQNSRRRDGHLLRLWAEVFHVSASGAGTVKWQQVSEDLVPVNITCIQDSPECVFHITAYNSQVDKILDVRLLQPGTRIGQASECFVYWKDPMTNDTWGLNFTSPIDAKQFRECCSPSFKFSRKASSSYSLKLEPPGSKQKFKAKRKPLSTPASPNRSSLTYGREPQCTCMTQEQYARLRAQDPRYRSSTLPRTTTRAIETDAGAGTGTAAGRTDKVAAATSSTSLYDNVTNAQPSHQPPPKPAARQSESQPPNRPPKSQETSTMTTNTSTAPKTVTASVGTHGTSTSEDNQVGGGGTQHGQDLKSEGVQAGGTLTTSKSSATSTRSGKDLQHMPKSIDYGDGNESGRESDRHSMHHHNVINNNTTGSRRTKSKSTEDMNMDSSTLKRMLKPMASTESPATSPEMGRRRAPPAVGAGGGGAGGGCPPSCAAHGHRQQHAHHPHYSHVVNNNSRQSSQRRGVGVGAAPSGYPGRGLYLELGGAAERDLSPPSDNVMFDNQCYATTPSSSNGNSDQDSCQRRDPRQHHHTKPCLSRQASQSSATPAPGSPTSRLLLEYEMHLRNTLAKGMDAESYSLHTFEALLSQSMEDLEYNDNMPPSNQRSPYPSRRRLTQESIQHYLRHLKEAAIRDRDSIMTSGPASQCSGGGSRSSTLPLPHRLGVERQHSARSDRDGYYSDRNELMRERERDRDRGYLSDHNSRDRIRDRDQGYLSDHQSSFVSASRCASCIGESARAAWYRHSDGWRGAPAPGPRRSPWDSLPSLRHEGSLNDSGYRSNRADSFEQRGVFDRQDSVRSEYTSDRESSRYGIVQQASIDSTDSRICYLTSSEGHTGARKGDARFCCVAHHCCLAAGALVALASNGRPKPRRERSGDSHSSGGETASKGDGSSGTGLEEPKRKIKHHHHHHHHHHHKIHSCPYHDVAPPPVEEPAPEEQKAVVPKKTVSPYLYIPSKLEPNVQQLFSFIESVLSAWAAEEGLTSTGEYSEPDERMVRRRKLNKYKRRTDVLNIRRIVYEVSLLRGTKLLGNVRFRHYHWKGTAETCNEAFLRKISDDDRMSLTTAVSDEEDPGESAMNSPYKGKQTGAAAASFNCTGAVRKTGFLSVKKWLLRKKHQIELARKRGWKGYWVCLKGTTLLFYPCDSREGRSVEAAPKHLIIVDGAIMQPIPEHPKRDYIFCLSTAFGDAYLFQAPCQIEVENWVNSIHSACAAAFARHRGKTGTLHLLQEEIYRLEKAIESDHKLRHMADLQQSVVSDPETRAQLAVQMLQWEENLERLHCEQFRLRCYMASLQSGELPNPKSLLTHVSRGTKSTLNKLGVFTVSSFHAFICARSPSLLNNLLAGRGATKRRAPNLSRSNSGSSRRSMQMSREEGEAAVRVSLPEGTTATVGVREGMTVEEFLAAACARRSLNALEHFVRVKKRRDMEDHNYFVPHRSDLIETYLHTHEVVEVCAKILYQVELQRSTQDQMWGFSVEAELIENAERQDELCCYVSRVEDKSVAMQNGIIKGDEIMVINGSIVSDLDMMYLESVLQEDLSLVMMMRSSRTEPPELNGMMRAATDDIIDSLVCPPPPSEPPAISDDMISGLIVPAPAWSKELYSPEADAHGDLTSGPPKVSSRTNSFEIENLLKSAEQVTGWCRSPADTRRASPTGSVASAAAAAAAAAAPGTPSRHLSDADKLRKVLMELVDTERAYVKHLNNLLENYLEPLKRETFLSNAEINALFGNIQEIVTFQRQFLQNLEEALEAEPNFHHFEFSNQFKNVLFGVGNAFLYYVNHFKLYSSFCASHSKAQKVLHPNEGNQALQEFLAARNPKQQHSSTLESYLIKPIQRILKYPLLLQQLRNLTDVNSEEHLHLVEALKGMEKVAEHINEMQRIHEEYGAIFDHLFRQHQKSCKQPIDLSPGDLLYYGGVEWLNISDFLGKIKKGLELHAMCFVFKSAVVFLCKERLRQKKKLMGVSSKNNSNEVEIIRYQVLIPVTEVQVRASSAKDMDSHFLWELIHLRSQLQRRSEKVYVLSNSTADFRNAFLKTIRQIIRESVRNMSLPTTRPAPMPPRPPHHHTLERPKHQVQVMQGSQTLGKTKKPKISGQRLSAGNIEVGDLSRENSQDAEDPPQEAIAEPFRHRSKTLGDTIESSGGRGGPMQGGADTDKSDGAGSGSKSEGEDEPVAHPPPANKRGLGRTPNHLTLSTTSTLSAGSTGSQARLIQSSHQPTQYQPTMVKELGSPVWKPRDMLGEASAPAAPTTLPRSQRPAPRAHHLSASRKSLAPDHRH